jgi:hypothetical protein
LIHCTVDSSYVTEHSGTIPNYQLKEDEIKKVEARVLQSEEIKVLGVYFVAEKKIGEL